MITFYLSSFTEEAYHLKGYIIKRAPLINDLPQFNMI